MLKSVFVDKICPKGQGQGQGHDHGCVFGNINFLVKFVEQIYQTYKLTAAAYTDSLTPVVIFAYYLTYLHCMSLKCIDRLLCCFCESPHGPGRGAGAVRRDLLHI